MRWPWQKREKRESGGDFSDAVVRLIEAQAAGTAADFEHGGCRSRVWRSLACVCQRGGSRGGRLGARNRFTGLPGASGARSDSQRRFDARHTDRPGRDGSADPRVKLALGGQPRSRFMDREGDGLRAFDVYNVEPARVRRCVRPVGRDAGATLRRDRAADRGRIRRHGCKAKPSGSLADEAQGPLAQLLAIPQDGGDDDGNDPLARLKADIRTARGKALLVETSSAGWGEGRTAAPQRDWQASRLGPNPPASMPDIAQQAFERVLSACGTPPSLFTDADGTSQREALRRWHLGTVLAARPPARA